jgi:16S rRNA (cytosine1402-N4)-methyltransferase
VLDALDPQPAGRYIDGTVGGGGHAEGILERSEPSGQLLGLDRDPVALPPARQRLARFGARVHLRHGTFAELRAHAASLGWQAVDGILLDLGLSSMQLADPERGFSFRADGPLDMRFDPSQGAPASELVNRLSEMELAELIARHGEDPQARRIARAIVAVRPLTSTTQLAAVVARAVRSRGYRTHPATRTFQALRIAVNDEMAALEQALPQAERLLRPGGRLAVIAFHSLEDRLVKRFFREASRGMDGGAVRLRLITRKPIRPEPEELSRNPRARSARLRVAEAIGPA